MEMIETLSMMRSLTQSMVTTFSEELFYCCLIFHVVVRLPSLTVNLIAFALSQRCRGQLPLVAPVASIVGWD